MEVLVAQRIINIYATRDFDDADVDAIDDSLEEVDWDGIIKSQMPAELGERIKIEAEND